MSLWGRRLMRGVVAMACALGGWLGAAQNAQAAEVDGLYLGMNAAAISGLKSTHEWATGCPTITPSNEAVDQLAALGLAPPFTAWNPQCSVRGPLGAAVEGRLGIRMKVIGLEAFLLGGIDFSSAHLDTSTAPFEIPAYASDMYIGRVGGGPGIGARFMTLPGMFRFTAGVGAGAMIRYVFTNVSSLDGSSVNYVAPMIRADLNIVLLSFLSIGVMGWVEFADPVKIRPDLSALNVSFNGLQLDVYLKGLERVTVFQGNQYFIGPYLGLHFGK
jgi:hypothetical protein